MAVVGTVAEDTRAPEYIHGTWTISDAGEILAGSESTVLKIGKMEIVDFYISTATGYSSGTYEVGLTMGVAGVGTMAEAGGRLANTEFTAASTCAAGFCAMPPGTARFRIIGVGSGVTALTVTYIARA
jgi:hypothetical protein